MRTARRNINLGFTVEGLGCLDEHEFLKSQCPSLFLYANSSDYQSTFCSLEKSAPIMTTTNTLGHGLLGNTLC